MLPHLIMVMQQVNDTFLHELRISFHAPAGKVLKDILNKTP
jgi:hypothetical protein